MVHSSRNKQKASPQKREVVGEDGWTRIVSPRRKTQTPARSPPRPPSTDPLNPKSKTITTTYQRSELPADTKVEQVIEKFKQLEKKWLQSDSWKLLKAALEDYTSNSTFDPIKTCIVFGTGTFSGLRQGWIERWDTALVQTAVFKSVADALGMNYKSTRHSLADDKLQSTFRTSDPSATPKNPITTISTVHFSRHSTSLRSRILKALASSRPVLSHTLLVPN